MNYFNPKIQIYDPEDYLKRYDSKRYEELQELEGYGYYKAIEAVGKYYGYIKNQLSDIGIDIILK